MPMSTKQTIADELTPGFKESNPGFDKFVVEHDQVDLAGSFNSEDLRKLADALDKIKGV